MKTVLSYKSNGKTFSRLIITFIYIVIFFIANIANLKIFALDETNINDKNYIFSFYYDNDGCSNCKLLALKRNIELIESEFEVPKIQVVYGGDRKSDFILMKSNFPNYEVLWDTLRLFSKTYNINSSLSLQVNDTNNLPLKTYLDIQKNSVDYKNLKSLRIYINLTKTKILNTFNGELLPKANKIMFDKSGNLLAIDLINNQFKIIDIFNNKLLSSIEPSDEIKYYYLRMYKPESYTNFVNDMGSIANIRNYYIKEDGGLVINYNVISDIKTDSVVKFDGKDSIIEKSKLFYSKGLLVDYKVKDEIKIYPYPNLINIYDVIFEDNKYFSSIGYYNRFNYSNIIQSDSFNILIESEDPFFQSAKQFLGYNRVIKEHNLTEFNTLTIGLYNIINSNNYFYLNPWNNIFFKYENSEFNNIKMQSFLVNLYKNMMKGYKYYVNNMLINNSSIFVLIQEFSKEKKCYRFIIQEYNINDGFVKEYIYNNGNEIILTVNLVKYLDKPLLIFQDKSENWNCIDFLQNLN